MPGIRDGVVVGLGQDLAKWACDGCGLTAVPLLFDDAESCQAYRKSRPPP